MALAKVETKRKIRVVAREIETDCDYLPGLHHLTLNAWDWLVADERIRAALAVAYHYHFMGRIYLRVTANRGFTFRVGQRAPGVWAQCDYDNREIVMSYEVMCQPLEVIASILVHECWHAVSEKYLDEDVANRVQREALECIPKAKATDSVLLLRSG